MRGRHRYRQRRGTVYLLVLAGALVITIAGVGTVMALGSLRAGVMSDINSGRAAIAAQSALDAATGLATNDAPWRAGAATGAVFSGVFGNCNVRVNALYVSGTAVTSDTSQNVVLTAVASDRASDACQIVSATLTPVYAPYTCLASSVYATGTLAFASADVYGSVGMGAAGAVSASASTIRPPVYSASVVGGGTYSGGTTVVTTPPTLPTATDLTYYTARATAIPFGSFSGKRIRQVLLSAGTNPYGATNAEGVYSVNCGGQTFEIVDSRIVGTLIVTNTSGVTIDGSVSLEPGASGYPTLIIIGSASFLTSAQDLSESDAGYNFNPAGTPYQGVTNTNKGDTYASVIGGIVYVKGNCTLSSNVTLEGSLVVDGTLGIGGVLHANYRAPAVTPPGFLETHSFAVVNSSIRRTVR